MKRITSIFMVVIFSITIIFSAIGCGDNKTIPTIENGKKVTREYGTYGLANYKTMRNPNIEYRLIWGNAIWGALLSGMLFIPTIYFYGFSLFEPIGVVSPDQIPGDVKSDPGACFISTIK